MPRIRRFSELQQIELFEDRYEYLRLRGDVGETTFGYDRYLNQQFYASREWKQVRNHVIARDQGCDLAMPDYEIFDRIYIHHMNPMTAAQIDEGDYAILDPEYLISTTHRTHNAIHYGDSRSLIQRRVERTPGDTKLW